LLDRSLVQLLDRSLVQLLDRSLLFGLSSTLRLTLMPRPIHIPLGKRYVPSAGRYLEFPSITNGHLRWATFRSKLSLVVAGSIVGSVAGSIVASVVGSIVGSVAGSIVASVVGSIVGSVVGSIVGSVAGSIVAIWPFLTVAVDVDATTNPHTARQAVRTFDRKVPGVHVHNQWSFAVGNFS
jgi:hypothetical protein